MNDMLETLTIEGYAVEIFHDPDIVKSPHTWCSSTLCIAHRRYNFGGEHLSGYAGSFAEAFAWHLAEQGLHERDIICLPIYMYEHGGIVLKCCTFNDRWDSGQVGFLYERRTEIGRHGIQRTDFCPFFLCLGGTDAMPLLCPCPPTTAML